jgi:hypothetical protein
VLHRRGRLVLTSWDYHQQPDGRPPQVEGHRPLLSAVGFEVDGYEETRGWVERQQQIAHGLLVASEELEAETAEEVADIGARLTEMISTFSTMTRRFLLVAPFEDMTTSRHRPQSDMRWEGAAGIGSVGGGSRRGSHLGSSRSPCRPISILIVHPSLQGRVIVGDDNATP